MQQDISVTQNMTAATQIEPTKPTDLATVTAPGPALIPSTVYAPIPPTVPVPFHYLCPLSLPLPPSSHPLLLWLTRLHFGSTLMHSLARLSTQSTTRWQPAPFFMSLCRFVWQQMVPAVAATTTTVDCHLNVSSNQVAGGGTACVVAPLACTWQLKAAKAA